MQVISTLAQVWVSHDEYYVIGVHRTAAQPMQCNTIATSMQVKKLVHPERLQGRTRYHYNWFWKPHRKAWCLMGLTPRTLVRIGKKDSGVGHGVAWVQPQSNVGLGPHCSDGRGEIGVTLPMERAPGGWELR
jgi:hypothetical protein